MLSLAYGSNTAWWPRWHEKASHMILRHDWRGLRVNPCKKPTFWTSIPHRNTRDINSKLCWASSKKELLTMKVKIKRLMLLSVAGTCKLKRSLLGYLFDKWGGLLSHFLIRQYCLNRNLWQSLLGHPVTPLPSVGVWTGGWPEISTLWESVPWVFVQFASFIKISVSKDDILITDCVLLKPRLRDMLCNNIELYAYTIHSTSLCFVSALCVLS